MIGPSSPSNCFPLFRDEPISQPFKTTRTWRHKEKCPQGVSQKKLAQPDMGLRVARLERDECILHSIYGWLWWLWSYRFDGSEIRDQLTSSGKGSWNPIVCKDLAPSPRWLFGISFINSMMLHCIMFGKHLMEASSHPLPAKCVSNPIGVPWEKHIYLPFHKKK